MNQWIAFSMLPVKSAASRITRTDSRRCDWMVSVSGASLTVFL
ncbi:hypothetical protein [Massilia eurypsychrophila]|nr:hypothetical protein [Massilia eurypsychrophila]